VAERYGEPESEKETDVSSVYWPTNERVAVNEPGRPRACISVDPIREKTVIDATEFRVA